MQHHARIVFVVRCLRPRVFLVEKPVVAILQSAQQRHNHGQCRACRDDHDHEGGFGGDAKCGGAGELTTKQRDQQALMEAKAKPEEMEKQAEMRMQPVVANDGAPATQAMVTSTATSSSTSASARSAMAALRMLLVLSLYHRLPRSSVVLDEVRWGDGGMGGSAGGMRTRGRC